MSGAVTFVQYCVLFSAVRVACFESWVVLRASQYFNFRACCYYLSGAIHSHKAFDLTIFVEKRVSHHSSSSNFFSLAYCVLLSDSFLQSFSFLSQSLFSVHLLLFIKLLLFLNLHLFRHLCLILLHKRMTCPGYGL
jgi:hypothetical protein